MSRDFEDYEERDAEGQEQMEYEGGETEAKAMERTNLPGIFLIVIAILNLLAAIVVIFGGVKNLTMTDQEFKHQQDQSMKMMKEMYPALAQQMDQSGFTPEQMKNISTWGNIGTGGVLMLLSLVTLLGGIKMRHLTGYGLAVTGSILACIPCLSPSACCCLGEIL
jgi:hypothetical protein